MTTMAAISLKQERYDPNRVHGMELSLEEITRQIQLFLSKSLPERRLIKGLESSRADIILAGALILSETLKELNRESILVSEWGVRHGLIIDRFG